MPINRKVQSLLAPYGVEIDAFYYCPHGPADRCGCRKPKPGMILQAAKDHAIDLQISWMIGDILHDVEAGNRAGCNTIHFDNGNETEWVKGDYRQPLHTVKDWFKAAEHCLPVSPVYAAMQRRRFITENRRFANRSHLFPAWDCLMRARCRHPDVKRKKERRQHGQRVILPLSIVSASLKVLVIGDAMLDVYLDGRPIVFAGRLRFPLSISGMSKPVPGGAANTAVNLAQLGAKVHYISVVGSDHEAEIAERRARSVMASTSR